MYGYTGKTVASITFGDKIVPPVISIQNPIEKKISLYEGQKANIRFSVSDMGEVAGVNLYRDGKLEKILGLEDNLQYVVPVGEGLSPGSYRYEIVAINENR